MGLVLMAVLVFMGVAWCIYENDTLPVIVNAITHEKCVLHDCNNCNN